MIRLRDWMGRIGGALRTNRPATREQSIENSPVETTLYWSDWFLSDTEIRAFRPEHPSMNGDIGNSDSTLTSTATSDYTTCMENLIWNPNTITPNAEIGKGSYGKVYIVTNKKTQQIAALKKISKMKCPANKADRIKKERNIWEHLTPYSYIISLIAYFETDLSYCFVSEYAERGTLNKFIKNTGKVPERKVKFFTSQIITGLIYIHNKGVMHRDLSSANILLDKKWRVKITDFGLSTQEPQDSRIFGTLPYVAPEILRKDVYDKNCDWWSVGILIYEMLVGITPLARYYILKEVNPRLLPRNILIEDILSDIVRYPSNLGASANLIIKKLLNKNPKLRFDPPSGQKIKAHTFFKGVNWKVLDRGNPIAQTSL